MPGTSRSGRPSVTPYPGMVWPWGQGGQAATPLRQSTFSAQLSQWFVVGLPLAILFCPILGIQPLWCFQVHLMLLLDLSLGCRLSGAKQCLACGIFHLAAHWGFWSGCWAHGGPTWHGQFPPWVPWG